MADYKPRMKAKYDDEIVKAMTEKFGYTNRLQVPKLEKITLNMGVGEASQDKKKVQTAAEEMALIAVKADVTEELDRLRAHVAAARDLLAAGSPVGRKLDFLSQEFNREANTLCSKAGDVALTRIGLALKAAVDQFREQVQNVV